MKYIDMHCDTLMHTVFMDPPANLYEDARTCVDFKRMQEAGVLAQFFAIFLPDKEKLAEALPECRDEDRDEKYAEILLGHFHRAMEEHADIAAFAGNAADVKRNHEAGKVSGLLTFEDGRCLGTDLDKLQYYYDQGIRLISLTWNSANTLGFPHSKDPELMQKGLTDFGIEVVQAMNRLGMIVDVSHLSDGGFWDVVKYSQKPFVASHSNCRALTSRTRNLTDDMIRALAEKGGVAGLNFSSYFLLNQDGVPKEQAVSRVEDMVQHLNHLKKVGGEGVTALGSDLDGISRFNLDIESHPELDKLIHALQKAGWTERQIDLFSWENTYRVMQDTLK